MSTYGFPSLSENHLRRARLGWQDLRSAESRSVPAERTSFRFDEAWQAIVQGESLAARRLRSQVERIAPYFRKALVRGEGGSGKRLVAKALHATGNVAGPFVSCNSASLAAALAEDPCAEEITTLVESVRGGTLYLEEIGDVPYGMQSGLLRFISEHTAGRSGGLRIVAGTCHDLRTLSSIGQFRHDLYALLSVVELSAPALRQRADDLPVLAECILGRVSLRTGLPPKILSAAAITNLRARPWPTNLRGLEQVVTHAAALADGAVIETRHLPPAVETSAAVASEQPAKTRGERLQDVIHDHVVAVLTRCAGNKLRAAEVLGISRSTLYRMLDAGPGAGVI